MRIKFCGPGLDYDGLFNHRTTQGDAVVELPDNMHIDGMRVMCARLKSDDHWWIIASSTHGDKYHTDVGPFDTAEQAVVYMKLLADPITS